MAIGDTKYHALLNRAKMLSNAVAWFEFFTTENKTFIIDLIRYNQLKDTGEDKSGEIIGFYSYATELATNGQKQEGDPYTLEDTGEFYQSMFVRAFADLFEINDGQGADKMKGQEWWSDDIVGLNEENLDEVIKLMRKHYLNYAKKVLFGA